MLKRVLLFSLLLFIIVTEGCRKCPKGIKKFKCLVNPCRRKPSKCKGVRCRANKCGGCNQLWYTPDGNDVTKRCECPGPTDCKPGENIAVCNSNPCRVSSCIRRNATCCPSFCDECKALWYVDGQLIRCLF